MSKNILSPWWKGFLTSILGTTISIALTFGVSTWVSNHQKEQARKQTAMMLIVDIDDGITSLEKIKKRQEGGYHAAIFSLDNIEHFEDIPDDTIYEAFLFIVQFDTGLMLDESTEKLFNSSQASWSNLDNLTFIKNVQRYYLDMHYLLNEMNHSALWSAPVLEHELYDLLDEKGYGMEGAVLSAMKMLLQEKLKDKKVVGYVHRSRTNIETLTNYIEKWRNLNDENKFLMNITDDDIKEYTKKIAKEGLPLTEEFLVGRWVNAINTENRIYEYAFRPNHTFTESDTLRYTMIGLRGKVTVVLSVDGKWAIDGDSLTRDYLEETFQMTVDTTKISYRAEMTDSIQSWLESNFGERRADYWKKSKISEKHRVRKGSLDLTHNKLELTKYYLDDEGVEHEQTFHLKRKKDSL